MNPIKQVMGTVTKVRDLSPTAREYTITPDQPLHFIAGAFVNIFVPHEGSIIRRAFSMSSSDRDESSFTLSIRLSPDGELTPLLWNKDFTGTKIQAMGPLGLNTADKMHAKKIYLFGFGVGAGVVKSIADHITSLPNTETLTIVTGNRSVDEILHKDYFDTLATTDTRVSVKYVVSDKTQSLYPVGYIQDHIQGYDFSNADVYMCGQKSACTALETAIVNTQPKNCTFFIEAFH